MDYIRLTPENLEKEHICCAVSNAKDCQVLSKKAWLRDRLEEGLVFLKGDVRGKCLIEYLPGEAAWAPIAAPGYLYINCFWVSGQLKGQGYSNDLLQACIKEAKEGGKEGLAILSSTKKMGFLSDPKHLQHKGFLVADTAPPYFTLLYLPLKEGAKPPRFLPHCKELGKGVPQNGVVIYYTSQCPYNAKYVPLLEGVAREKNLAFQAIHLETLSQAQAAPSPFTTFSLFYNGAFVTHEILSEKKFEKLLQEMGS